MQNSALDLTMLISLPLNAISMYELALQFIFDSTPQGSVDYQDLLAALAIMQETNRFTSNSLAQADKRARLREIQKVPYRALHRSTEHHDRASQLTGLDRPRAPRYWLRETTRSCHNSLKANESPFAIARSRSSWYLIFVITIIITVWSSSLYSRAYLSSYAMSRMPRRSFRATCTCSPMH